MANTYTDANGVRWIVEPNPSGGLQALPDPSSPKQYRPTPPTLTESVRTPLITGAVDAFANAFAGRVVTITAGSDVPWYVWLGLAYLLSRGRIR